MTAVEVLVVGAGAAGLMAAITAARRGRSTVLLEKNQRPGLKILISGGGRCNVLPSVLAVGSVASGVCSFVMERP